MYSPEQLCEIYRRLAEPFPEEAIERTKGSETKKGYDTTGIKYQYIVNRLNEVLGVGGFRFTREFALRDKQTRSGYPMVEATCDLTLQLGHWENGDFVPFAEATGTGGHSSSTEADAKKGSFTNGFKKTAAFFGVGRQAYEGSLDDDNVSPSGDPVVASKAPNKRAKRQPTKTQTKTNGSGNGSRVTQPQLATLHSLVDQLENGDWSSFRRWVSENYGSVPEYLDRKAASKVIDGLMARVRKEGGNGAAAPA